MESEKGPPDRRRPPPETIVDAVRFACHGPKYRWSLRKELAVLEYLNHTELQLILAACNIDQHGSHTADDARSKIRRYLQRYEAADRDWWRQREAARAAEQLDMDMDCDAERDGVQYRTVSKDDPKSENIKPSGLESQSPVEPSKLPDSFIVSGHSASSSVSAAVDVFEPLSRALTSAAEALAAAAQFIRLLSEGQQPSETTVAGVVSTLEKTAAAASDVCGKLPNPSTVQRPSKPVSYAQAAANSSSRSRPSKPRRNSAAVKAQRQQIAQEKAAIRDDKRAIKLKPLRPKGALDFGVLARAVASCLRTVRPELASRSLKEIVEDVRMDARGQYYIQFPDKDLQTFTLCLFEKSTREPFTDDHTLVLPDIGDFLLRSPTVALTAGMTPMVISGIPVATPQSEVMAEIWSANHAPWGLASADRDKHLAGLSRLQTRHQSADQSSVEFKDSRSVKIFVSRAVMQHFKARAGMVRYEYSHLPIRPFEQPQRKCSHCGAMTRHSAATCRSQKH